MIGKLAGCYKDYQKGKWIIQLETDEQPTVLDSLRECLIDILLKKHRKKRTLTANAYYWQLLGDLAKALKVSNAYLHNTMLRRYSTVLSADMTVNVLDTDEAAKRIDESTTYHLMPTSYVTGEYRLYLMLKGSHDMDSAEFARLLNGLIEECQEQGIETLTPDEVAKLKYLEGSNE